MLVLVTYDVSTTTRSGRKRLRKISELCSDFGRRVQFSVFECHIDPGQWERLKHQLLDSFNPKEDSLRFYRLGANWKKRVEHHGVQKTLEVDEPQFV